MTKPTRRLDMTEASKQIRETLDLFGSPVWPEGTLWLGQSDSLSRDHIMAGALAFVVALDITTGNTRDRNLYDLLDLYLRNEDARKEINEIIVAYGRVVFRATSG